MMILDMRGKISSMSFQMKRISEVCNRSVEIKRVPEWYISAYPEHNILTVALPEEISFKIDPNLITEVDPNICIQ